MWLPAGLVTLIFFYPFYYETFEFDSGSVVISLILDLHDGSTPSQSRSLHPGRDLIFISLCFQEMNCLSNAQISTACQSLSWVPENDCPMFDVQLTMCDI